MIRKQSSIDKMIYEVNDQKSFFGRDNLSFKTVNMSKKRRLDNICRDFKLKKLIKNICLPLTMIKINKI